MKVYLGVRSVNGCEVYIVKPTSEGMEHKPLKHLVVHSPTGFEWGYGGSGPADLALSILGDFFEEKPTHKELWQGRFDVKDEELAKANNENELDALWNSRLLQCWHYHQGFKDGFVSTWPKEGWTISGDIIRRWIEEKKRRETKHGK